MKQKKSQKDQKQKHDSCGLLKNVMNYFEWIC